jgi:hypothetical protein
MTAWIALLPGGILLAHAEACQGSERFPQNAEIAEIAELLAGSDHKKTPRSAISALAFLLIGRSSRALKDTALNVKRKI